MISGTLLGKGLRFAGFSILAGLLSLSSGLECVSASPQEVSRGRSKSIAVAKTTSDQPAVTLKARAQLKKNPTFWPPMKNQFYPDMELINQDGRHTRLSDFRGKVIVVQFVASNCGLSQALSGANRAGFHPYGVCFPPKKFNYFPDMMRDFTGYGFNRPDVAWVQILLYNENGKLATTEDVRKWAENFELKTRDNIYVLAPTPDMDSKKSKMLVPGFHLINRAFVLVSDSAGAWPEDDLFNKFLPTLRQQFF